jgi:hypothetical protein
MFTDSEGTNPFGISTLDGKNHDLTFPLNEHHDNSKIYIIATTESGLKATKEMYINMCDRSWFGGSNPEVRNFVDGISGPYGSVKEFSGVRSSMFT